MTMTSTPVPTPARPYRTREHPSEIVSAVANHAILNPDQYDIDPTDLDSLDPEQVRDLAEHALAYLGIHDSTAPVLDLLPLAMWAVLNGAPEELVTFSDDDLDSTED